MQASTASSPYLSFGRTLRAAIKSEFGTSRKFAVIAVLSPGRVSQLVGEAEEVSVRTLDRILACFEDAALQELICDSWVRHFSPVPTYESAFDSACDGINLIRRLKDRSPLRALNIAYQIRGDSRSADWYSTTDQIVQLHLKLGQASHALNEVLEMERRSRSTGDADNLISALRLKGIALRAQGLFKIRDLFAVYAEALQLLGQSPSSPPRSEIRLRKRAELERDLAVHLLVASERRPAQAAPEFVREALKHINVSLQFADETFVRLHCLEIRSRIECAEGRYFNAEETFEEQDRLVATAPYRPFPRQITEARIAAGRGQRDHSIEILKSVLTKTLDSMSLHHHRVADQTLSRVLIGT
jgi:tetratricopeptide (TPR) repeat protein